MKIGRPTIYTEELANNICDRLSKGESLRRICRDDEMPERTTVHLWLLDKNKKDFFNQYAKACDTRADELFDELEEIARTEEDVSRARLIVDTRKWYLSKVMPKKYGDKMDLTTDGKALTINISQEIADKNDLNS